jgi:hypothetical protein
MSDEVAAVVVSAERVHAERFDMVGVSTAVQH